MEIYQIIHFLPWDWPLWQQFRYSKMEITPFLTWNIRFWFLISKIWDHMLCLRLPLLDCRSQLGWIQTGAVRWEWLKDLASCTINRVRKNKRNYILQNWEERQNIGQVSWISKSSVGAPLPQNRSSRNREWILMDCSLVVNDDISSQYQETLW